MDKKTKGAWLLAQSKNLDAVTGAGAARLENISYAGRIGRLYNLLRRNVADDPNPMSPVVLVGLFKMPLLFYLYDVGLRYLLILIIAVGMGAAVRAAHDGSLDHM
jgi:hypothetical protein